jgi:hypothetical protein
MWIGGSLRRTMDVVETVVVVVAVVDTVAVLVTVLVTGVALAVCVGPLTVTRFVEDTVSVDRGCLPPSCAVTVSVLPTPATSPITTHNRGSGDERQQAGHPREGTARAEVPSAARAQVGIRWDLRPAAWAVHESLAPAGVATRTGRPA